VVTEQEPAIADRAPIFALFGANAISQVGNMMTAVAAPWFVLELTGTAASFELKSIGPVIQPLYDELRDRLDCAGLTPTGPDIAYYEDYPDSDGILVHATLQVNADPSEDHDFAIVDLPEIEHAARSCTAARWTTSCRPSRRWLAGSTPMDTAPPATTTSCTSSAARTEIHG